MGADEIDAYLSAVDEPKRSTLEALRRSIRAAVPEAEEGISYGMPAFRVDGKVVAGFAAFKNHLAYLPHSGSVLAELAEELAGYERTSGSLHFAIDQPLPDGLVGRLVEAKLAQLAGEPFPTAAIGHRCLPFHVVRGRSAWRRTSEPAAASMPGRAVRRPPVGAPA